MESSLIKATSVLSATDNKRRKQVFIAEKPRFYMHVDADRDGTVDDDFHELDIWTWGPKGRGAVIVVNNNAAAAGGSLDNADAKINGAADVKDIAPLDIRRRGPLPPAAWKLILSVDPKHKDHIRIFDKRTADGNEIIGPKTGVSHTFSDLNFDLKALGMEGLAYAGLGFDGLIEISLKVMDGAATLQHQKCRVRVAPWIAFNHLNAPEKLYVVETPDNAGFVDDVRRHGATIGLALDQSTTGNDRWMQDVMEFGYSQLPGQVPARAVLETPRSGKLSGMPKSLVSPDMGYLMPAPVPADDLHSSLNSGGNLECTPPFTSPTGKWFPFGRLYYCVSRAHAPSDRLAPGYEEFLRAQVVQRPIAIDAGWLNVGHVDEMISFIPAKNKIGFKLLLASPALGFKLLTSPEAARARMLVGRNYVDEIPAEMSVTEFLANGISWKSSAPEYPSFVMSAREIKNYNVKCQAKITQAEKLFRDKLGLVTSDIAYVPSIYVHPVQQFRTDVPLADALTAGMVNMLVLGTHCISPKPFGPMVDGKDLFEEHFRQTLEAEGLTVNFIDDWTTYHLLNGEVHCGTNTLRRADSAVKWWEFKP